MATTDQIERIRRILRGIDGRMTYGPPGGPAMPPYEPPSPTGQMASAMPLDVEGYRPGGSEPLGPWDERDGLERLFPDKHSPQAQWSLLDRLRRGGPEMPDAGPRDIKVDFGGAPIVFGPQGLEPPHPGVQGMAAQFDPSMLLGTPFEPPAQLPAREMAVMPPERSPQAPRQSPPSFEPQGPTSRQSAVSGLLPGIGEMPRGAPPSQTGGGMDDTRFRGPHGEQAPDVDLGGAVLPGAADTRLFREPTREAPQGGGGEMDPQRRLELMKAARMFREAGSQFRNVTGPSEMLLRGGDVPDRSVVADDLRDDEERLRRGDFENPNSPASIGARQMIADATGQEVPEGMSAAVIMALNPMFDRLIRAQYAGMGQQLAMSRDERAQRGEERHARERGEDIRRGREKELRGAFATERKDWLSPTGQIGKYREGIEMTDKALALLDQGGAQAFGTALSLIIKGIGKEAGNIAQKEREVLLGEIGIPGLVTKGIKAWTGDYTPEQYEAMKNVAKKAKELIERDRGVYQSQRMDSFSKTHRELLDEAGIGMDELQGRLGVETAGAGVPPAGAGAARPGAGAGGAGQGGQVRVTIRGQDGPIWMDRAEAQEAARKGWVETHDA